MMLTPQNQAPVADFATQLQQLLGVGWKITSDGPTGVQLEGPKVMAKKDKWCLWIGIITVIFYGVGLFFIGIAMLDFWFMTKPPTKFLPRTP